MLSAFLPSAVWGVLISLEQPRRAVIWAEALFNYFLLSYPIMMESILAGICACGRCWCCRPFCPLLYGGVLISLEQRRRAVFWAEALFNYFLLSYPIMMESILVGICACGMCWCCRPFRPSIHCFMGEIYSHSCSVTFDGYLRLTIQFALL